MKYRSVYTKVIPILVLMVSSYTELMAHGDLHIDGKITICIGDTGFFRATSVDGPLVNPGDQNEYKISKWSLCQVDWAWVSTPEDPGPRPCNTVKELEGDNFTFSESFTQPGDYKVHVYYSHREPDGYEQDGTEIFFAYSALLDVTVIAPPNLTNIQQPVDGNCIKQVTLETWEAPSGIIWGWEYGSQTTVPITEETSIGVWAEGPDGCRSNGSITVTPYIVPDAATVLLVDSRICNATFDLTDIDQATCKFKSLSWDFGDNTPIIQGQFEIDESGLVTSSSINHDFGSPSDLFGDGNGYHVRALLDYSCNVQSINNATCIAQVQASKIIQIEGPTVEITPSFSNSYCSTRFDYGVVFKDPFDPNPATNELDHVQILGQEWRFADGAQELLSNQKSFVYNFPTEETRPVTLTVDYLCRPCGILDETYSTSVTFNVPEDMLETTTINESAPIYQEVLKTAASEYNSAWPLAAHKEETYAMHPYAKGSAGVWRTQAQYVFNTGKVGRSFASDKNMKEAGSFNHNGFVWNGLISDQNPGWLKASQVTKYNSSGNEIENKDVQDVYSAAVYTYDQKLPLAVGQNMAHQEMAFTSFEKIEEGYAGNFFFSDDLTDTPFQLEVYNIRAGLNNMAIVDAPLSTMAAIGADREVEIITPSHATKVKINCSAEEIENGENYVFVDLSETIDHEVYTGYMVVATPSVGIGPVPLYTGAHTGQNSLAISGTKSFRQHLLQLDNSKKYYLSTWVAVNPANGYYNEPLQATGLGIEIVFTKDGIEQTPISLYPSGPIVEGWQQVEGTFTTPQEYDFFDLRFKSGGASTAYFDDLRLFPSSGNLQSYVYDDKFRVTATLDQNNFATLYSYDEEGKVYQVRKETSRGIRTIQSTVSHNAKAQIVE